MFTQLIFLTLCFVASTLCQITLLNHVPLLQGPFNLILLVGVIGLLHIPHISILLLLVFFNYTLDAIFSTGNLHLIASIIAGLSVYLSVRFYPPPYKIGFHISMILLATFFYEMVLTSVFLFQQTEGVGFHLISYLPKLLVGQIILGLAMYPFMTWMLSLFKYRKIQLGTRQLKLR